MGFVHEHIILPLSDLAKGERVHHYLRLVSEADTWTPEQLEEFQNQRLRQLVQHVAVNVPYYHNWFGDNCINPDDVCTIEELHRLPIVNKTIMRSNGIESHTAMNYPVKNCVYSKSSGSTGEPFSFYVSKEAYSVNMAAKLLPWYKVGYRLGDRYMKIANGPRQSKLKVLQDRLNHCLFISFFSVNDDTLKRILDLIEQYHPSLIRSYPVPLYLLAQYRNSHDGYTFTPHHIMTTGSTLPTEYRHEIEQAFSCDVMDSYSCEGTPNVFETLDHDGYRVCGYYGIIEVLDENNQPITNGVGRVVSTDLWNYAHPFLRYDTQDLVEVKNGIIKRIMGRESESFIQTNGEIYTVHNFSRFFLHDLEGVDAYQIIRHKDDSVTFLIVNNHNYSKSTNQQIISYWSDRLGVEVKVERVDDIPLMNNNKRLVIVNE